MMHTTHKQPKGGASLNRVELKKVKFAAFASEETHCFSADVYINGERAGTVSNEGRGGGNFYHPMSCEMVLQNIARTMPPVVVPGGKYGTIAVDADILIGDGMWRATGAN